MQTFPKGKRMGLKKAQEQSTGNTKFGLFLRVSTGITVCAFNNIDDVHSFWIRLCDN